MLKGGGVLLAEDELADDGAGEEGLDVGRGDVVDAVEDYADGAGVAGVDDADGVCVDEGSFGKAAIGGKLEVVACGWGYMNAGVDFEFCYVYAVGSQGEAVGSGGELVLCAVSLYGVCVEGADIVPYVCGVGAGGDGGAGIELDFSVHGF